MRTRTILNEYLKTLYHKNKTKNYQNNSPKLVEEQCEKKKQYFCISFGAVEGYRNISKVHFPMNQTYVQTTIILNLGLTELYMVTLKGPTTICYSVAVVLFTIAP